jgi:hypothetical protein
MAITLVASVSGIRGSATAAINTTGATLLVASTANAFGNATITDSKSNTWIPLTAHNGDGTGSHRFFYCLTPIVGTGHTFTPAGSYASCIVYAFAAVGSYHSQNGNQSPPSTSPMTAGTVTPPTDGALIVTGLSANDGATDSVTPAGFAQTTIPNGPGANIQNSAAWLVQTTAASITPTWAWTGGGHSWPSASTAVFLPAGSPVPNVFNALEADAITTLTAAGFTVGTITYLPPPVALVTAQSPTAGTPAVPGYPVDLVTTEIASGHVVSQSPAAGELAVAGTPINLVVVEVVVTLVSAVTQAVVETLTLQPAPRVTQDVVELLLREAYPVRVTLLGIELLRSGGTGGTTRTSQLAVEVFHPRIVPTRTTQLALEVYYPRIVPTRLTQTPVEFFQARPAETRSSQEAVEIFLVPPVCITGAFAVDDAPAGGSCPAPVLP